MTERGRKAVVTMRVEVTLLNGQDDLAIEAIEAGVWDSDLEFVLQARGVRLDRIGFSQELDDDD